MIFDESLTPGYAMLMSPNEDKTAVHGCHYPGNMVVRMRNGQGNDAISVSKGWCIVLPCNYSLS